MKEETHRLDREVGWLSVKSLTWLPSFAVRQGMVAVRILSCQSLFPLLSSFGSVHEMKEETHRWTGKAGIMSTLLLSSFGRER